MSGAFFLSEWRMVDSGGQPAAGGWWLAAISWWMFKGKYLKFKI